MQKNGCKLQHEHKLKIPVMLNSSVNNKVVFIRKKGWAHLTEK